MDSRNSIVALLALTTLAVPAIARAQNAAPVSPSTLLSQRAELSLTPAQVRELTLLTAQVRRHQQAVLRAPSKPWIANTKGTSTAVAAKRAMDLLSPEQQQLALRRAAGSSELAVASPVVVLD